MNTVEKGGRSGIEPFCLPPGRRSECGAGVSTGGTPAAAGMMRKEAQTAKTLRTPSNRETNN